MVQDSRIKILNRQTRNDRDYVLYWMQASQRTEFNHALEYAIEAANKLQKPLLVFFALTDAFPEANVRHYQFMLQGLREVARSLELRGIKFIIQHESPELAVPKLAKRADLVVTDRGYLKIQRFWREQIANQIECPLIQVESDVVVPIEIASQKEQYAAATIRPRILRLVHDYLVPLVESMPIIPTPTYDIKTLNLERIEPILEMLAVDRSVTMVDDYKGGTSVAKELLEFFLDSRLAKYDELRNDPSLNYTSHMSPYLHFGQISPVYIALKVMERQSLGEEAYLEELIVRRELSMNFVYFNQYYDSFDCLHEWAQRTLLEHAGDRRDYVYESSEFEQALTHDPYWNAAQNELRYTGKMHGYMRMYWGKKILEWTKRPQDAIKIALYLNNKYELDGRDPNGYTGVAWCFGKHDRAWVERKIFGKIRYMNANGLKRKFDIDAYVRKVAQIMNRHVPTS